VRCLFDADKKRNGVKTIAPGLLRLEGVGAGTETRTMIGGGGTLDLTDKDVEFETETEVALAEERASERGSPARSEGLVELGEYYISRYGVWGFSLETCPKYCSCGNPDVTEQ
jgi:hypothetical protein